MKQFLAMGICAMMVLGLWGCSEKQESNIPNGTVNSPAETESSNIIDGIFEDGITEEPSDEMPSPELPKANPLDLPLVATDNVYIDSNSEYASVPYDFYVTNNNELVDSSNNVIDTNVRSVRVNSAVRSAVYGAMDNAVFYLKTDNSLWGFGNNVNGQLGDGTGVDKTEPIRIMDDVATFGMVQSRVYAIKTDRTYWVWGSGFDSQLNWTDAIYEPVKKADNIVRCIEYKGNIPANDSVIQTGDGKFLSACLNQKTEDENMTLTILPTASIKDLNFTDYYTSSGFLGGENLYWLDSAGAFWHRQCGYSLFEFDAEKVEADIKIAENVDSIFCRKLGFNPSFTHYIGKDSALYGFGDNSEGQIGDGTKIPREEPVKIADDVKDVGQRAYIKNNGELWTWNSTDPSPVKTAEGAVMFIDNNKVLFNDGRLLGSHADIDTAPLAENVRIPETTVYP